MYRRQSFTEKITSRKPNDEYDLCNAEVGRKFFVQWSPQDGARYLSKNRYASPRSLSKSVPRRNRALVRYNINRSLNFDLGSRGRTDCFGSPNSSSDSNLSNDGDNYLSRSAKILRALNIDYSPQRRLGSGVRKINKSLNFDQSPSPKRLPKFNNSKLNISSQSLTSPLPRINKTLNFETSSGESSVHSRLDSSVESIDENQNQTPSQRNRKAKKSLNYPSPPAFKSKNFPSTNLSARSPMLRNELRAKIDDIIQTNVTPNLQSSKRNLMRTKFDDFGASTPRNLFNDFRDDDNDEHNIVVDRDERPRTPENFIKIVPESMSAIKKSHKKERVLGRLGKAIAYQAETRSGSEPIGEATMDAEAKEKRPTTPLITIDQYESPQCGVNSIKKSHKKNKSKRRSYIDYSEDEMSDTGSIFDYTDEARVIIENSTKRDTVESKEVSDEKNDRTEEGNVALRAENVDAAENVDSVEISRGADENLGEASNSRRNDENSTTTTPEEATVDSLRPSTPENRINFLHHVMTDSIKKSHKKVKDTNKKTLFKSRIIRANIDDDKNIARSVKSDKAEEDRAATPENTNSSRLLLSQFSSVKKSHKKDKHRRMISGSLGRKKFFARDHDVAGNSDEESHSNSLSSSGSDFAALSPSRVTSDVVETKNSRVENRKIIHNEFSSSDNSNDAHYHSLEGGSLEIDQCEAGIRALSSSNFPKSSPNKRKSPSDDSPPGAASNSPVDDGSIAYESAEEEFKIFTPIKKRKSLNLEAPVARRICDRKDPSSDNNELTAESPLARCSTPTTGRGGALKFVENHFKTPVRSDGDNFVAITDNPNSEYREETGGDVDDGRATPQDQSTAALMAGITSIKKSHKKDKRGNAPRRFRLCARESESRATENPADLDDNSAKSSQSRESPKPSTSYARSPSECIAITDDNDDAKEQAKTPPNCLQAMNYLKLMRTESIKKSHKKVRERKIYRKVVVDSELSNDGSIFDEAERSRNAGNDDSKESENSARAAPNSPSKVELLENSFASEARYDYSKSSPRSFVSYTPNVSKTRFVLSPKALDRSE